MSQEWIQTFGVGSYYGIDGRYPSRRRKNPVGFSVLETKRKPRPRKKAKRG